jgi:hypothetical protein
MNPETKALYCEAEYSSRNDIAYRAYLRALESVIDFGIAKSICDVGCSSGWLIHTIKKKYPTLEVKGIDYFEWAKKHSHESIRNFIDLADMSKEYRPSLTFDIVNCSEVGEHIEPEFEDIFIDNLARISGDVLILGWSNDKVDNGHQHLNPRPQGYISSQMKKRGFEEWVEISDKLRVSMREECKNGAYDWWWMPLTIYKRKKYLPAHSMRFIQGCSNDNFEKKLLQPYSGDSLQIQLIKLRDEINLAVINGKPLSFLRFSDGDIYFANALPVGSAKPGSRALTIEYSKKNNISIARRAIYTVDYVVTEIGSMARGGLYISMLLEIFYKCFPNYHKSRLSMEWKYNRWYYHFIRKMSEWTNIKALRFLLWPLLALLRYRLKANKANFPILSPFPYSLEVVYALVSSRLIFKMFPKEIMLVGQFEKLEAIKHLMKHEVFRSYLGVESFCSYVGVKAIGAADNEDLILKLIEEECQIHDPKIILIGIGSAKLYVLPKIKQFSNAVVIDVGAGIDAIAGTISQDRPYFAEWVNYRSKDVKYDSIDFMDQNNPNRNSKKYKTVELN